MTAGADALPDGAGYYQVGGSWVAHGEADENYAVTFDV